MLIFDIETHVVDTKPNSDKDLFKFIGLYEYETDEYHFLGIEDKDKIIEIFKRHRVIIGFNSKFYDEPIMKRSGLWRFNHCHLDLKEIIMKRAKLLGCEYQTFSLDNLAKFFNLESQKFDFDYDILKKDSYTKEELEYIKEYTLEDIKVTKELFDFVEHYFKPFEAYMSEYDARTYKWLTSSISSYTYKVICFMTGIREEYSNDTEHVTYDGGYVAYPTKSHAKDNIYCLDFNSLYPHNNIQGNLFSTHCNCCKEEDKWTGNDMFPVQGKYCSKKQGKVEKVIQRIYIDRVKFKKEGNRLEYALKNVINTLYGLTGNPIFKNLYNHDTASDCTLIGRKCVQFARKKFMEAGYELLYGDTDSVFVKDNRKDKKMLMAVKDNIIKEIKDNLQFPSDTFDMGIDAEIKYIWFFKSGEIFKKKHYMYVTTDGDLIIKGLSMIKNDSSKIGYHIFKKYMKEQVKNGNIMFDYNDVKKWVGNEIKTNLQSVARSFKVWEVEQYKNPSQIQAAISTKYGAGTHILIPNKYVGVGKSVKYCTIDEFRESNLSVHAIILNKLWSELAPFMTYKPHDIKIGDKKNGQEELLRWTNI